ncbi:unnamed protein product [Alternaria alternata]
MRIIAEAVERPPLLDMVSRGLLDMFSEHTIPMWLTYGVQLHFDSLDILGEESAIFRPRMESQYYLTHLIISQEAIEKDWEDPMMPKTPQYALYNSFKDVFNDTSPWVFHDGFSKQWERLKKDPKVGGHPIFRVLKSKPHYLYEHNPLLCGMMKYHTLVHWYAAGISHEATSCSLLFMAHVYMDTQLRSPSDPVWPDMEFMLFSQDPRYLLLKRPPESPEEARTLFDIASNPRYDPNNKTRFFRDASVFGDSVYLPRGAVASWINKKPGGAFNGKIDTIAKALLAASSPDATRGRLARAMQASQEKQGLKLEPLNGKEGLTLIAILQHFAFWLQADMPDLCFNGALMQRQCSDTWKAIYKALERDPAWDSSFSKFGKSAQRAANAIISTSVIEGKYPHFIDIARKAMLECLQQQDSGLGCPRSEVCLMDMVKYHKRAARLLTDDGPLSIDNLYKGWTAEQKQQKKDALADAVTQTEGTTGDAGLEAMFKAQALKSMMGRALGGANEECMVM